MFQWDAFDLLEKVLQTRPEAYFNPPSPQHEGMLFASFLQERGHLPVTYQCLITLISECLVSIYTFVLF